MSANRIDEIREQLGYLTESGKRYLWIDIANTYGYDKMTFDDRIAMAKGLYNKYLKDGNYLEADSPWEFKNACEAMRCADAGLPVEHMVYLDCTNQALQLYAIATSCSDTGYLCNISSGNVITDAYGELAKEMNRLTNLDIFNRDNCKKSLMVTLYGKMDGESEIIKYFLEQGFDYKKYITDEDISKAFKKAINGLAPFAMKAMDKLQSLNNENIDTYYWTMPDGFRVKYDVKSTMTFDIKGKTKGGINFSFEKNVNIYKGNKFNRGMAPNVIHSIDGYIARELVRRMTKPNPNYNRTYPAFITTIHDAFATHPNNAKEMVRHYEDIMCELNESDILQDIMSQIAGHKMLSLKKNTLTNHMIRDSIYKLS